VQLARVRAIALRDACGCCRPQRAHVFVRACTRVAVLTASGDPVASAILLAGVSSHPVTASGWPCLDPVAAAAATAVVVVVVCGVHSDTPVSAAAAAPVAVGHLDLSPTDDFDPSNRVQVRAKRTIISSRGHTPRKGRGYALCLTLIVTPCVGGGFAVGATIPAVVFDTVAIITVCCCCCVPCLSCVPSTSVRYLHLPTPDDPHPAHGIQIRAKWARCPSRRVCPASPTHGDNSGLPLEVCGSHRRNVCVRVLCRYADKKLCLECPADKLGPRAEVPRLARAASWPGQRRCSLAVCESCLLRVARLRPATGNAFHAICACVHAIVLVMPSPLLKLSLSVGVCRRPRRPTAHTAHRTTQLNARAD